MSNDSTHTTTSANQSIGFFGLLFIVFLILKLGVAETAVVGWSWWWVTAPLWGPTCFILGIILIVGCIWFLQKLIVSYRAKAKARKEAQTKE